VRIHGEIKQVEGTPRSGEAGDIACYLSLETAAGAHFTE